MSLKITIALELLMTMLAIGLLSIVFLSQRDMILDESIVEWIAQDGFTEAFQRNKTANSAPPLYALAVAGAHALGFAGEELRLVSWFALFPLLALTYRILRQRGISKAFSIFGLLLVGTNIFVLEYMFMLREYSWTAVLALAWLCAWTAKGRSIAGLLAIGVAAIWLQYGLWFLVGTGWLLLGRQLRLKMWLAGGSFLLLNMLVVYVTTTRHQLYVGEADYLAGYMGILNILGGSINMLAVVGNGGGFLGFGILLALGWRLLTAEERWLIAGVWVLMILASTVGKFPYGGIRQDMALIILLVLVAALGVTKITTLPRLTTASAAFWLVGSVAMLAMQISWLPPA